MLFRKYVILTLTVLSWTVSADETTEDLASQQLLNFSRCHEDSISILTTSYGARVDNRETTSLNKNLMNNVYILPDLQHFVRENIPARRVHAKGFGAFGVFEVTNNLSRYCKAKLFSENGKKTKVAVRFSPAFVEKGSSDTIRNPIGFSAKFYTEQGNFDLTCFNNDVFGVNDPILFTTFVHSLKNNPVTQCTDPNMLWDSLTLFPETFNVFLWLFGDIGTPYSYRHMNGNSIHTFQIYNENGESYFTRFYWKPDSGLKNMNATTATRLAGEDPDYYGRDLYNAIASGNYPSWTLYVQILTKEQALNESETVFDVTKRLSSDKYPLTEVGKLTLNKNPTNHFADVEQIAFCPGTLVPGILGAPDKMFEARRFSYRDAAFYRLGANFNKIHVNAPLEMAQGYDRDGAGPVGDNMRDYPNYFPNSFGGPVAVYEKNRPELIKINEVQSVNTDQCAEYYYSLNDDEKNVTIENLSTSLSKAAEFLQIKAVNILINIDEELGYKVADTLGLNSTVTTSYDG